MRYGRPHTPRAAGRGKRSPEQCPVPRSPALLVRRAFGSTVTLLRVIPVDLLSRLTDLLDHDKRRVRLNYSLNTPYDVIRYHQEAVTLNKDRLVGLRLQVDLLQT
jgi:hypothetical protein